MSLITAALMRIKGSLCYRAPSDTLGKLITDNREYIIMQLGNEAFQKIDLKKLAPFYSITRFRSEISVIFESSNFPSFISPNNKEEGWKMFSFDGKLDFAKTGVLHSVLQPLAFRGISVLVISTFDTDCVFFKKQNEALVRSELGRFFKFKISE